VYSVDIDVGGTLTDGIFSDGQRLVCAKVDSTAHDLTVCLFDCLTQGATQLGFADLTSFLEHVELLRWSTTITSNVLAELRGPKIGLIVSKGHERNLYGKENDSPIINKVIDEANVIGFEGAHGEEILGTVRALLESGVRRICISLKGAQQNPEHEREIKRIIEEQYPDHYLGSVPVLTGSDICQNIDDMTRTYYAVINAYTHSALAATLFKAEDELRYTQGYTRAFLISHINGGVAGVSKTRAIDTMESGPILGIYGTRYLANQYGLKNVIALDVGGTTAKVGLIQNGETINSAVSDLFGIPVRVSLPYLRSIALGGGSVVSCTQGEVRLGPESKGSFPGPACYGLGGEMATLTDAFVVGGLIDPEYFLAGTKHLEVQLGREALQEQVARPLGFTVEEACRAVIERACDMVAGMITFAARERHLDLSTQSLIAYGGNGGLFACSVAQRAGIRSVYLLDLGPVFSAFGSSVSDILHVYERSLRLQLNNHTDVQPLNCIVEELRATGLRDLSGEGISADDAEYGLELEFSQAGQANIEAKCLAQAFKGADQLRNLLRPEAREAQTTLEVVRMKVKKTIARPALIEKAAGNGDSSAAVLGSRSVAYGSRTDQATIYRWELLHPGAQVRGCALLESENSTYFVPEGWSLTMDRLGNAQLQWYGDTMDSTASSVVQEGEYGN
jgi:acetophenone carboxylase